MVGGGGKSGKMGKGGSVALSSRSAAPKSVAGSGVSGGGAASGGGGITAAGGGEKARERSMTKMDDGVVLSKTGQAPKRIPLFRRILNRLKGNGGGGTAEEDEEMADVEMEGAAQEWLCDKVRKAEYFHGMIHKDEIGSLLKENGDVILRLGRSALAASNVTLSVMGAGKPRHFMIEWEGAGKKRKCWVDPDERFPDEVVLVEEYVAKAIPMGAAGYILKRPVTRADWELATKDVSLTKKIGKGAFGEVYLGILLNPPPKRPGQTLPPPAPNTQVAVKICDGAQESQEIQNKFMKEAEIGRRLCHPNVIRIYGVQCREHPLLIVMEFAGEGSLLAWLRRQTRSKTVPPEKTLLGLCRDAALGVEYLHKHRVLHRDIAARNFLVGQGRVLKIADFGHAKAGIMAYKLKTKIRLAFKWCAPEVMESGDFGEPSDVWSLGVTCWEILSCGEEPFEGVPKHDVKRRVLGPEHLRLMPKPSWSPDTGDIFRLAFVFSPKTRASVPQVLAAINKAIGPKTTTTTSQKPPPKASNTSPTSLNHSRFENPPLKPP